MQDWRLASLYLAWWPCIFMKHGYKKHTVAWVQNVGKHWRCLLWIAPYLDSWHEAYQADFEGSLILIVTFINTAWSDFIQAEFNLNINLPTKFWFYVPKDFKWNDFQNFVTCNLLISQDMKSTLTITNHQLAAHSWKSVEVAQRGFNPQKIT